MTAVSEVIFQGKRNPETYPCTPFFSLSLLTVVTVVAMVASTDRREHTQPFEKLKRYLAQQYNPTFFSLSLLAFLALLHNGSFNSFKAIPIFTLGIFGILAFSKSAKMQGVHVGNY